MSYSSVKISLDTLHDHRELLDFCNARNLRYVEEININLSGLDESYRKPTKALKTFCGVEWANSKGLLQPKVAVQRILATARRQNLDRAGGIIELNDTLKEVLATDESSILLSSLPTRVAAQFSDA